MRGFAVIVVMLLHAGVPAFAGGGLGVDIFFVLSGYLITSILFSEIIRTGSLDFLRFFAKRAFRLVPALGIALLLTTILTFALRPHAEIAALPMNLTAAGLFFMDVHVAGQAHFNDTGMLGHTWSLAVEERYYMFWPAILLLTLRKTRSLAGFLFILWVFATLYYATRQAMGIDDLALHFRADNRLSGLIMGSMLAAFVANGGRFERAGIYARLLAPVMLIMVVGEAGIVIHKHALTEIGTALIILAIIQGDRFWNYALSGRFLVYTGRISYGLYLYHMIAIMSMAPLAPTEALLVAVPISVVAAILSFHLVERPILEWGRNLLGGSRKARHIQAPRARVWKGEPT